MTKAKEDAKGTEVAVIEGQEFDMSMLAGLDQFKAKAGEVAHGMESIDATDLKIPVIRILQPTSAEVGENKGAAGQYFNSLTGQVADKLRVTFLTLTKGRVYFEGKFKRGARPNCVSLDGIRGTRGTSPFNRVCAECEFSQFVEGEGSPCKNTKGWIGFLNEDGTPFRFSVKSMALANTKNFTTMMKIKAPNYPFYVLQVELGTEKKSNDSGVWFEPTYKIIGANSEADSLMFKEMLDSLKDTILDAQANDLDTEHHENDMVADDDAGLKGTKGF